MGEGEKNVAPATHAIPAPLLAALEPVTVVCGHYGVGKTNFSVNLALDAAAAGMRVTLIDMDIVNPYFRATEQRSVLEAGGVRVIAPVMAEKGTALDLPNLTGAVAPAITDARAGDLTLIDLGGDDVGAAALGRFSLQVAARPYAMLLVVNRHRNLIQDPTDAVENLRQIEAATRLRATAVVDNAHLKGLTDAAALADPAGYASAVCDLTGLPLVAKTCPELLQGANESVVRALGDPALTYPLRLYVKNPWE